MKITKDILKSNFIIDKVFEDIGDYPAYCNQSNLSRGEALAIQQVLDAGLDNTTEFEITIKKL